MTFAALDGIFPTKVFATTSGTFILTRSGALYAAGANDVGQLAQPLSVNQSNSFLKVTLPIDAGNVTIVAAGRAHILVRTTGGSQLYCWGSNDKGHCGTGFANTTLADHPLTRPTSVGISSPLEGQTVTAIWAMPRRSFAQTSSNTYAWGLAADYILAGGDQNYERAAVLGSVFPGPDSAVTDLSCPSTHVLALGSSGTPYSWGDGSNYQLGLQSAPFFASQPNQVDSLTTRNIKTVKACYGYSLALGTDGSLFYWGSPSEFATYPLPTSVALSFTGRTVDIA
eukprot:TRINITY_DN14142_c0_g1_i1.p1 TRINITY_DN14142_c0_g1~~TRINITY_DN14142_c0_g1_i1.p1  ORF type:complete len:283 (+),score=16.46 TRINITY_DN14142_c0_g1_i1:472-1320(+)